MTTKHDADKVPLHRGLLGMFPRACSLVARASAAGAEVYGWDNWRTVEDGINRYRDASVRHAAAIAMGEEFDAGTKLPHAALVAWNAMAALELECIEKGRFESEVVKAVEKARLGAGEEEAVPQKMLSKSERRRLAGY